MTAVTDDDLARQAVAADPDPDLDDDAASFWELTGAGPDHRLPQWYMPSPMPGTPLLFGWRRRVVLLVIASFVAINAYGLCSTYGWVAFG